MANQNLLIKRAVQIFQALIILNILVLTACGDGVDDSTDSDSNHGSGWVKIVSPAGDYYTMSSNPLRLSGEAFISPTWFTCCSGSAQDTAVTVKWENQKTGQTGYANQQVETCGIMQPYYLCNHTWSASIHTELGENVIKITAEDPGENKGTDTVTVNLPYLTSSVYGRIRNTNNNYSYFNKAGISVNLTGEGVDKTGYVSDGGPFEFHGLNTGSYVITPMSSSMSFTFVPGSRNITLSDTKTTGVDFTTSIYNVSGRVGNFMNNVRISGTNGSMKTQSGSSGYYWFRVPSGTYTIAPYCGLMCWASRYTFSFSPTSKTITVSDQDIGGVNFNATLTPL